MAESAPPQVVRIACKGSHRVPLKNLEVIQGDLKELSEENYQKLRRRIETIGFDAPLFVWKNHILDGTQRLRVLTDMVNEGWELPDGKVPVAEIKADSLDDAKERVLGYSSQYGRITEDGLYELLSEMADPDIETLDLPDFNMNAFREGFLDDDGPNLMPEFNNREVTGRDMDYASEKLNQPYTYGKEKVEVSCPKCGAKFFVNRV